MTVYGELGDCPRCGSSRTYANTEGRRAHRVNVRNGVAAKGRLCAACDYAWTQYTVDERTDIGKAVLRAWMGQDWQKT